MIKISIAKWLKSYCDKIIEEDRPKTKCRINVCRKMNKKRSIFCSEHSEMYDK